MTEIQVIIFMAAAFMTFVSYQMIPSVLSHLAAANGRAAIHGVVTAPIFTLFVRFCGLDHLVMSGFMGLMTFRQGDMEAGLGWVVVASAWIVAMVSFMSAMAIWAEKN